MSEAQLGKLVRTPEDRDAIHVAVAPVLAREILQPGERINIDDEGMSRRNVTR